MQYKALPFYSKAIFQKAFFSRAKREELARKPLVELIIKNAKLSDIPEIANVKVASFAYNLAFIGMAVRRKVLNYLYNDSTSQYQRKYVINKIAEYNMKELSKQGFSKAADAIIVAALGAKTDHDVQAALHYPIFSLYEQKDILGNRDYQAAVIAASKYAPESVRCVVSLGAYQELGLKNKIFKSLSHALQLGGHASFKMLAEVYANHINDNRALGAFSDVVLLVRNEGEMHAVAAKWWNHYCV